MLLQINGNTAKPNNRWLFHSAQWTSYLAREIAWNEYGNNSGIVDACHSVAECADTLKIMAQSPDNYFQFTLTAMPWAVTVVQSRLTLKALLKTLGRSVYSTDQFESQLTDLIEAVDDSLSAVTDIISLNKAVEDSMSKVVVTRIVEELEDGFRVMITAGCNPTEVRIGFGTHNVEFEGRTIQRTGFVVLEDDLLEPVLPCIEDEEILWWGWKGGWVYPNVGKYPYERSAFRQMIAWGKTP